MLLLCLWHVCNGIGYCYDDHGNQLSDSPPSPELSSVSFFYCPDRAQRAF